MSKQNVNSSTFETFSSLVDNFFSSCLSENSSSENDCENCVKMLSKFFAKNYKWFKTQFLERILARAPGVLRRILDIEIYFRRYKPSAPLEEKIESYLYFVVEKLKNYQDASSLKYAKKLFSSSNGLSNSNEIVETNNFEALNKQLFLKKYLEKFGHLKNSLGKYCYRCPLVKHNLEKVNFEVGYNAGAPVTVMFIGLNPGNEEAKQKRPFIGRAGKLLRKYIEKYIVPTGAQVVITNIYKCSTPNQNELDSLFSNYGKESIVSCCSKYLIDEIKMFKPKVIVTLGTEALKVFNEIEGIEEIEKIGVEHYGLKHPSYYLRNGFNESNVDEKPIEEYEQVFSVIRDRIKPLVEQNKNENGAPENRIIHLNSIDEIPKNMLLLDINILETQNKFVVITTDEKTHEVYYYVIPFTFELYVSNDPGIINNDFIRARHELQKVEIKDFKVYKNLLLTKKKEFSELIKNGG